MIAVSSQRSPIVFGDEALREWRRLLRAELTRPGFIVVRVPEWYAIVSQTKGKPS